MLSQKSLQCPGCFPIYQPNQLAHSEWGGCLWCSSSEEDDMFKNIEQDLEKIMEIDSVSYVSVNSTHTECCICLENINKERNNCVTECGHMFCLKCLANTMYYDKWSCPYCRQSLIDVDEGVNVNFIVDSDDDDDLSTMYTESDDSEDEPQIPNQDVAENANWQALLDASATAEPLEEGEVIEDDGDASDWYDNEEFLCPIEEITEKFTEAGFTQQDLVAMLLGRYRGKYSEEEQINLNRRFEAILFQSDKEYHERCIYGNRDEQSVS